MGQSSDVRSGRMWTDRENRNYRMDVFDAFGNRDNYDYFYYCKQTGKLLERKLKCAYDMAVAHWEEYYVAKKERPDKQLAR